MSGGQVQAFEIDNLGSWLKTGVGITPSGKKFKTEAWDNDSFPVKIDPRNVASIQPVFIDQMNARLGPRDEKGIPCLHSDARSIICVRDKEGEINEYYVADDLIRYIRQVKKGAAPMPYSGAQKLAIAVHAINREAIEDPDDLGSAMIRQTRQAAIKLFARVGARLERRALRKENRAGLTL